MRARLHELLNGVTDAEATDASNMGTAACPVVAQRACPPACRCRLGKHTSKEGCLAGAMVHVEVATGGDVTATIRGKCWPVHVQTERLATHLEQQIFVYAPAAVPERTRQRARAQWEGIVESCCHLFRSQTKKKTRGAGSFGNQTKEEQRMVMVGARYARQRQNRPDAWGPYRHVNPWKDAKSLDNYSRYVSGAHPVWADVKRAFRQHLPATSEALFRLNQFMRDVMRQWFTQTVRTRRDGKQKRKQKIDLVLRESCGWTDDHHWGDALDDTGSLLNAGISDRYQSPLHCDNDHGTTIAASIRCS